MVSCVWPQPVLVLFSCSPDVFATTTSRFCRQVVPSQNTQLVSQAPQLSGSSRTSVSHPSRAVFSLLQFLKLEPQLTEHCPSEHDALPPLAPLQASSQSPQLLVLVRTSVSQPSRSAFSSLQLLKLEPQVTEHAPLEHDALPPLA